MESESGWWTWIEVYMLKVAWRFECCEHKQVESEGNWTRWKMTWNFNSTHTSFLPSEIKRMGENQNMRGFMDTRCNIRARECVKSWSRLGLSSSTCWKASVQQRIYGISRSVRLLSTGFTPPSSWFRRACPDGASRALEASAALRRVAAFSILIS